MSRCPATILADKRTDKVTGRIIFLIISTNTIKFINLLGVPIGVRWVIVFLKFFSHARPIIDSHIVSAIENVTTKCAVGVKLKGKIAAKFIINTIKKTVENTLIVALFFFSLICLNSLNTNNINIFVGVSVLFCDWKILILLNVIITKGAVNQLVEKYDDAGSNIENMLFIMFI